VQEEGGAERRPPATWKAGAPEPCSSEEIVLWRAAGVGPPLPGGGRPGRNGDADPVTWLL
jgi:hypothetical protein